MPHAGMVACIKLKELRTRLQAWVLELQSYGCTFVDGLGAWEL